MDNEIQLTQMNGSQFLDSRDVAKMIDKKHKNLIRDIEKFISDISTGSNLSPLNFFVESSYKDAKGEKRKCYLVTKQGCEVLANKMTGKKGNQFTARYVDLFNKMQVQRVLDSYMIADPVERAKRWIEEEQKRLALANELEQAKPAIEFYNDFASLQGAISIKKFSGVLISKGLWNGSPNDLYADFRNRGFTLTAPGQWNNPSTEYIRKGWLVPKTGRNPYNNEIYVQALITPTGVEGFTDFYRKLAVVSEV